MKLADLEIIGYANVLKPNMLPAVVPPVFRLKTNADVALLPPFLVNGGLVGGATQVQQAELEELKDRFEITLFENEAIAAQPNRLLWIDQNFQHHYESITAAKRRFRAIATDAIAGAVAALQSGKLEEAEGLASVAVSADDKRLEPYAIKAALRRFAGNQAGEELMAELAEPLSGRQAFEREVDSLCAGEK